MIPQKSVRIQFMFAAPSDDIPAANSHIVPISEGPLYLLKSACQLRTTVMGVCAGWPCSTGVVSNNRLWSVVQSPPLFVGAVNKGVGEAI